MTTLHEQWTALYTAGRVRWMPGMSDGCYRVTHSPSEDGEWVDVTCDGRSFECRLSELTEPDFSDPATIGCLLHQAREAWDSPRLQTSPMLQPAPLEWICYPNACEDDGRRYLGDSEPAAILAAIAAAPPKVTP